MTQLDDPRPRRRGPAASTIGWIVLFVGVIGTIAIGLSPSPYVVERPGPVYDVLGTTGTGATAKPLIGIPSSQTTYPTTGVLDMLTVYVDGHIYGIRDATQIRIFDEGVAPPTDLTGAVCIHTAPGVKKLPSGSSTSSAVRSCTWRTAPRPCANCATARSGRSLTASRKWNVWRLCVLSPSWPRAFVSLIARSGES